MSAIKVLLADFGPEIAETDFETWAGLLHTARTREAVKPAKWLFNAAIDPA